MFIIPIKFNLNTTQPTIEADLSEITQDSSSSEDVIIQINYLNKTLTSLKEQMKVMNEKVDSKPINRETNANLEVDIKPSTEKMDELRNEFKAMKVETERDVKAMKNEMEEIKSLRGQSTTISLEESQATDIILPGTSLNNSCHYENSKEWLNATRLSNIDEDLMTDEMIKSLIVDNAPTANQNGSKDVLGQTICSPDSSFINWKPTIAKYHGIKMDSIEVRDLAFRLMFLALHENQFGPAREEAIARLGLDDSCPANSNDELKSSLKDAGVGKLDYECPGNKYIISSVPEIGFGASARAGMTEAFFFGMVTGRTVLFLNSLDYAEHKQIKLPLRLASCPRQDIQCMYMPFSPCVITKDDFMKAPKLSNKELQELRSTGKLNDLYENEKAIVVEPSISGTKMAPPGLRDAYANAIASFYQEKSAGIEENNQPWDLNAGTLNKVLDYIKNEDEDLYLAHQISIFYILRPNMQAKNNLAKRLNEIFPAESDPALTLGLPIRGSDKCGLYGGKGESQCLSFNQSIEMAKEFVSKRERILRDEGKNASIGHIILTSEDKKIIQARTNFTKSKSFPFDFIINDRDAGQGSGFPKNFEVGSADNIMFSSLMSLQMQMRSESILVNGCSNFHKLIIDLVIHGCGSHNYLEEYQNNDNPKFRMRCNMRR